MTPRLVGILLLAVAFPLGINAEEVVSETDGFRVVIPNGARKESDWRYTMPNRISSYEVKVHPINNPKLQGVDAHESVVKSTARFEPGDGTPLARRDGELAGRLVSEFLTRSEPAGLGRIVYHHLVVVSHSNVFHLKTDTSMEDKRAFFDSFAFVGDHVKPSASDAIGRKDAGSSIRIDGVYRCPRKARNGGDTNVIVYDYLAFSSDEIAYQIEGDWNSRHSLTTLTTSGYSGHDVSVEQQPKYILDLTRGEFKKALVYQGNFKRMGNRVSFSYLNRLRPIESLVSFDAEVVNEKLMVLYEESTEIGGDRKVVFADEKEFEFVSVP